MDIQFLRLQTKNPLKKAFNYYILNTLLPYDYIAKDPETKRYSLGFKSLEISRQIKERPLRAYGKNI